MASGDSGDRRTTRTRALTEKGQNLFEEHVEYYTSRLLHGHKQLSAALEEKSTFDSLHGKSSRIEQCLDSYEKTSAEFLDYLSRVNTLDSQREAAAHLLIRDSVCAKARVVIQGINAVNWSPSQHEDNLSSVSSTGRTSTTSDSYRLKHLLKLTARKAELKFAQREANLRRAKAKLVYNQSNLETDMEMLSIEKQAAVATAELQVLCSELDQKCDISDDVITRPLVTPQPIDVSTPEFTMNNMDISPEFQEAQVYVDTPALSQHLIKDIQTECLTKTTSVCNDFVPEGLNNVNSQPVVSVGTENISQNYPTFNLLNSEGPPLAEPMSSGLASSVLAELAPASLAPTDPFVTELPVVKSSPVNMLTSSTTIVNPVNSFSTGRTSVNPPLVNPSTPSAPGYSVAVNPFTPGVVTMNPFMVNPFVHSTSAGPSSCNVNSVASTFSTPAINPFMPGVVTMNPSTVNPITTDTMPVYSLPLVNSLTSGKMTMNSPQPVTTIKPDVGHVNSVQFDSLNPGSVSVSSPLVNFSNPSMQCSSLSAPVVNPLAPGTQCGYPVYPTSVDPLTAGLPSCSVGLPNDNSLAPGVQNVCSQSQNINSQYSELSKFLIKKDLLLSRLTKFDEKPETYLSWKNGFLNVMTELSATTSEQLDLLIKYLGNDSSKWAVSLKSSNADMPDRALSLVWERLDERFGSPEFLESALKNKLAKFPQIFQTQTKRLYDLSDILFEINSVMNNPSYKQLFAYYNTSSGIKPIIAKLPFSLQNKWMSRVMRYKTEFNVAFPPFSEVCAFVREMSVWYNDPAFSYVNDKASASTQSNALANHGQQKKNFSAKKTTVSVPNVKCPLHPQSSHRLKDCTSFRKKPFAERKKILRNNHFCFKCVDSVTHGQRDCTSSVKCDICKAMSHPTALHIENKSDASSNHQPSQPGATHGGESSQSLTTGGAQGEKSSQPQTTTEVVGNKCTRICGPGVQGRSCAKIVPVKIYPPDKPEKAKIIYAILDDQSNGTLARSALFDDLDLTVDDSYHFSLTSCAGHEDRVGRRAQGLMVESLDGNTTLELPPVVECDDIPNERKEIPTPEITSAFDHLQGLRLPPLDPDAEILLLIGRDMIEAHVVLEQRIGSPGDPFAQRLALGWVVVGKVCLGGCHPPGNIVVTKTHVLGNGRPTCMEPCLYNLKIVEGKPVSPEMEHDIFRRTKDDDKPGLSIEDSKFLEMMDRESFQDTSGHWAAPLPFRQPRPPLPNNRDDALRRARSLQAGLRRDPVKKQHFVTFMAKMLERGHAEVAPPVEEDEEVWYLPLFGVYHPKKPDKIRVVFDSSAQCQGISLNSVLITGPNLTNNLVGVLLRFRRETTAIMADIEMMFYGFHVVERDRNYLRFLWHRDNNPDLDLIEYRMCVHVFGNSPSPAVASYGLRRCVQMPQDIETDDVLDYVTKNFYVDDGIASFSSAEQAIDVLKKTQHILLKEGRLRLHKIASNNPDVLAAFPVDDLASDLKNIDFMQDDLPSHYSLGLCWDINTDSFVFKVPEDDKPSTRRGILSTVNSLFDPLGFLAPVTIHGKVFLRDITMETKDWDEPLTPQCLQRWKAWKDSLRLLEEFTIPRCYVPSGLDSTTECELHVFCDASERAISAVSYLRVVNNSGQIQVGFVCGKSKVAPKHGHTIPRLELCAAVLAVEVADLVNDQLDLKPQDTKFYTDSQVVLGYLYNEERRFFTYVANRVSKVRKSSRPSQWQHVATGDNPADEGTRHVPPDEIMDSMWIKGPPFLAAMRPVEPDLDYQLVDPACDKEIKPAVVALKTDVSVRNLGTERFKKFSNWQRLITAYSWLTHIATSFQKEHKHPCHGWHICDAHKTPEATSRAERRVIMESQCASFHDEIRQLRSKQPLSKSSPILALAPYLDEDGILRVGGRLKHARMPSSEKNPILISGRHHIATLLIRHCHEKVQHQGRHFTEGAVRSAGYWITGGKRLISSLIFKCVKCRRLRGKLSQQKMADLPQDRLSSNPPFTFVGIDVFGPWQVCTRRTRGGSANSKRWAVIFTCLGCRAIHIELIEEMSTSSFINSLRRFIALRGPVKEIRSDRGTNFVGAIDELHLDAVNIEDTEIKKFLHKSHTVWLFNTPHSSHMGGSWERLIGTVRRILESMLMDFKSSKLTHEVLSTFMAEVTAIVNSRPLVPVSSDVESPFILSPAALLTQKSNDLPEQLPTLGLKDIYRSQWRCVQVLADNFWSRWRREYLQTLQPRRKWMGETPNVEEGDIVLLRDKEVPRNQWPLGRVSRVFPSNDELIRKLEVCIVRDGKSCLYIRPVTEVVRLIV